MGKYLDKKGLSIVVSNLKKYIDKRVNSINLAEMMPPIKMGGGGTASGTNKPALLYWNINDFTWRSDDVGSSVKPIYLSDGVLTASSSTLGDANTPVYLSSGTLTKGNKYATSSSDIALKQDIDSVSKENIDKIDNVEIHQFCFKDEPDTQKYGVIAQEVEKPGLDNLLFIDTNTYKAVDYYSIFSLKIKSLEEKNRQQQEEINELKSQISEIKKLLNTKNGES